ncbi:endonuclease/exonuclease/phosphatase family protein [Marinobacter sp.]|uniref:sunset domain-containing protein n=1 Tax=Marinobacter sp. TaxID=50741 RepID=UPI003A93144A
MKGTRRWQAALLLLCFSLLPILSAYADIIVGSWNIQRLGHGDQKSYPALAAIASKVDLLAVQEVMTDEGIEELELQLEKHTSESWSYIASHALGSGSYKEKYAFIWRDSAVEYDEGAVVYLDRENLFSREPFSAKFRSKRDGTVLALGTVHIIFGKRIADRKPEINELANYWQWMKYVYPDTPLVLLGDFNLPPSNAAWASLKQHAKPLLTEGASTLSAKGHYANLYDNIWVEPRTALLITDAGVIDFPKMIGWSHKKSRKHVSDHAPIYMALGNAMLAGDAFVVAASSSVGSVSSASQVSAETKVQEGVRGNRNSKIYHRPDCPSYGRVSEKNRVAFETFRIAEAAGYRLAGNCP